MATETHYSTLVPVKVTIKTVPLTVISDHLSGPESPHQVYTNPDDLPERASDKVMTVVLDLDETLISARDGPLVIRPYAVEFLLYLRDQFPNIETVVWSAGHPMHVNRCLKILSERAGRPEQSLVDHAIGRGPSWCTGHPVIKNLRRLPGRPRTIIVDDNPQAALADPSTAVIIPPFTPSHPAAATDTTLLFTLQVIVRCYRVLDACTKGSTAAQKAGIPHSMLAALPEQDCHWCSHPEAPCGSTVPIIARCWECEGLRVSVSYFVGEHPFLTPYEDEHFKAWQQQPTAPPPIAQMQLGVCLRLDVAFTDRVRERIASFQVTMGDSVKSTDETA